MRRLGEHSLGNRALFLSWEAVAYRAIVRVNLRAGQIGGLIGGNWRSLRHLTVNARVQGLISQRFFKRHGMVFSSYGRAAGGEIEICREAYKHDSKYNSEEKSLHWFSLFSAKFPGCRGGQIIILDVRQLLRILWMSLVLLIVALTSALVAMRLAIHGSEVKVPDFRGKTPAEARQMAEDSGLNAQIQRQYYSASVPGGRILSQIPDSGTTVRRGWDVRLAVSLGPQRVTIPQVVGASQRAALITIDERGLDVASTASVQTSDVAAGQVLGQDPPANATDASSPKISLLIAQESAPEAYVMPGFIDQPLGSVSNVLKDAGFSVGKVTLVETAPAAPTAQSAAPITTNVTPSPAAIIVSQDPAPGQKVVTGSAINFLVR